MKTVTVFTWGYSKRRHLDLGTLIVDHNIAHVIDVRARPNSRNAEWRQKALQGWLGPAYIWAECFGNPSREDPLHWNEFRAGLSDECRAWRTIIRAGRLGNIVVVCLEQDPWQCHRLPVAEYLTGIAAPVHLGWPEVQA